MGSSSAWYLKHIKEVYMSQWWKRELISYKYVTSQLFYKAVFWWSSCLFHFCLDSIVYGMTVVGCKKMVTYAVRWYRCLSWCFAYCHQVFLSIRNDMMWNKAGKALSCVTVEQDDWSKNTSVMYLGCAQFENVVGHGLSWGALWFSSVLPRKCRIVCVPCII
jgi:hypothetical protein